MRYKSMDCRLVVRDSKLRDDINAGLEYSGETGGFQAICDKYLPH